ncbi:MAG: hypothetical protein LBD58_12370, partial [Treponema sp.]|nr:hypothetical protein [Treponema sp.]
EADPAAEHELEAEDIDLSDVIIDEPDLSGQLQENPLQEPVLEAIAFDDMPLNLSDEDHLPVDRETVEISEREDTGEEPLEEMPEEEAAEEYSVGEPIFEEEESTERPVAEEYSAEEFLPKEEEAAAEEYSVEEPIFEEEESTERPVAEEYSAREAISEEEPAESATEKHPVEESLPTGKEPTESAAIPAETASGPAASAGPVAKLNAIPSTIQQELKTVLSYMDQLLESLPEEKIEEFAASKYFDTYKKLFSELGLV